MVPPLEEQVKIAEVLTAWDDALETLGKLIAAKLELKRGLMQAVLTGKKRFQEFETREKWKNVQLRTIFERITQRNTELNDNVLTISGNHGLINQREIFNKRIASVDASNYYLIYKNEFAYNKSYSIGYDFGAIKRLERYEKGIVSSLYICFGLKNPNADGDFYKQYFDSNFLNQGISEIAQEGARNHGLLNIAVGDFLDLDIPLPPLEEQSRIAEVLITLDTELEGLRGQLERVKMQKKGLMQHLLTGKTRVKV